MTLAEKTKSVLIHNVMENKAAALDLISVIDTGFNATPATVIAALGTTSNLSAAAVAPTTFTAVAGTYAIPAEPTGAEVDATANAALALVKAVVDIKADNADLETLRTQAEARLDAIEAKIDALIAALKTAGLMELA